MGDSYTPPDPYSVATQFGGVTDWYQSQGYREPVGQLSSPFEDGSYIGSPGVDGPSIMPEDPYAYIMAAYQVPPSPDYILGPEEPQSPPPLDFVPEPMYPEYMPQEDEILPAEEQPLPDPEEEPEEDDEDPEEDPADYLADRDDDDDEEEEEEPSEDDANDKDKG
ncbi:hypothetical protein Tco_1549523 [Tanacetum coccineum]